MHYHPAGEFKFEDHHSISISPCTPSELGELCDEIERRNLALMDRVGNGDLPQFARQQADDAERDEMKK